MQEAYERDCQANNGVAEASRMAGFLAYRPTRGSRVLRQPGFEWAGDPLGSSRFNGVGGQL
eukprot:2260331-Lingulodinium_polyedra.AAC.1